MPVSKKKETTHKEKAKITSKKKNNVKKLDIKSVLLPEGLKTLYQGDTLRFVFGLFALIIALFMVLSFISHFFTGNVEQTAVEGGLTFTAQNYGGKL